ncbi:DUF6270 domain-containing protein [Pengzhenrongella sp.]|jgi:hypothetical protein|uniref:DUF6270 domain-containing protein n=1 Tax=Pengzhenrongella sp. TaxID=2888820 RepID=UPI002F929AE3
MKVAILGSCVTRDALELASRAELPIAGYFARSSIASAFGSRPYDGVDLAANPSAFQRRIVEYDLVKHLPTFVATAEFDVLVVDLIDERFDLLRNGAGALCTYSVELSRVLPAAKLSVDRIRSGSEEFFELWTTGWLRLLEALEARRKKGDLLVHRVFWATESESGKSFEPAHKPEAITRANAFLARLYDRMALDLLAHQFVTVTGMPNVGAEEHTWGRSPFHFTREYGLRFIEALLHAAELCAEARERGVPPTEPGSSAVPRFDAPIQDTSLDSWEARSSVAGPPIHLRHAIAPGLAAHAFLAARAASDHLVVFLPSAPSAMSTQRNPSFHRWPWHLDLPEVSVLALSDPALYQDDELCGSWFVHPEHDLIEILADVTQRIARRLGVAEDKVLFYGSSMGGFGALGLASCLHGALAVAEVPQLSIRDWPIHNALRLVEERVTGCSLAEYEVSRPEQVDVRARFARSGRIPPFVIISNTDESTFRAQASLIGDLAGLAEDVEVIGDQMFWVSGEVSGHALRPKDRVLGTVRRYLKQGW